MKAIGIDIGGANLKAADAYGQAMSLPFAMWKEADDLQQTIEVMLASFQPYDLLAVTMTAELADCFETKAAGVNFILTAVERAANETPVVVWQTGAEFVSVAVAREIPLLVAAANWHGLATWLGRIAPQGNALLIDIGSTTTDIIPLLNGVPIPAGLTDRERLQSGELVYSGTGRTSVSALVKTVPLANGNCPVAAEFFATTSDIYLLLDDIPEDPENKNSANGQPATKSFAHNRLAHCCCCDSTEISLEEAEQIALHISHVQQQQIIKAIEQVLEKMDSLCQHVIISGSGSFLAKRIIEQHSILQTVSCRAISEMFAPAVAQVAPAYGLAQLAQERIVLKHLKY